MIGAADANTSGGAETDQKLRYAIGKADVRRQLLRTSGPTLKGPSLTNSLADHRLRPRRN